MFNIDIRTVSEFAKRTICCRCFFFPLYSTFIIPFQTLILLYFATSIVNTFLIVFFFYCHATISKLGLRAVHFRFIRFGLSRVREVWVLKNENQNSKKKNRNRTLIDRLLIRSIRSTELTELSLSLL